MLFTWSFKDLCIVFPRWHITGIATLIISLLVIVLLSACYEAVRNLARRYEVSLAQRLKAYMGPVAAGTRVFFFFSLWGSLLYPAIPRPVISFPSCWRWNSRYIMSLNPLAALRRRDRRRVSYNTQVGSACCHRRSHQ